MKNLALYFILICYNNLLFTQVVGKLHFITQIDDKRYENFKGSPYMFDDFLNAKIFDNQGEQFENIQLNFNGFTQNFERKFEGELYLLNTSKKSFSMSFKGNFSSYN